MDRFQIEELKREQAIEEKRDFQREVLECQIEDLEDHIFDLKLSLFDLKQKLRNLELGGVDTMEGDCGCQPCDEGIACEDCGNCDEGEELK